MNILYTDSAYITVSPFGLQIEFLQPDIEGHIQFATSVGMSLAHAKAFQTLLNKKVKELEKLGEGN